MLMQLSGVQNIRVLPFGLSYLQCKVMFVRVTWPGDLKCMMFSTIIAKCNVRFTLNVLYGKNDNTELNCGHPLSYS